MFMNTIFGVFLDQGLYTIGLQHTSALVASALTSLLPALTLAASPVFGLEKHLTSSWHGRMKIFSTITGIIGVLLLTFTRFYTLIWESDITWKAVRRILKKSAKKTDPKTEGFGVVLLILSYCFNTSWFASQRKLNDQVHAPFTATAVMSGMGAVLIGLFSPVRMMAAHIPASTWHLNALGIGAVFYNGIIVSALSFSLNTWCLTHRSALYVAVFSPLSLFFDTLFEWAFEEKSLYVGRVAGGVLVALSLYTFGWARGVEMVQTKRTWIGVLMSQTRIQLFETKLYKYGGYK